MPLFSMGVREHALNLHFVTKQKIDRFSILILFDKHMATSLH
jgi:hypothetical protein